MNGLATHRLRPEPPESSGNAINSQAMRTPLVVTALLSLLFSAVTACGQSSSAQTAPSPTASPVTGSVAIYITAATKKGVSVTDLKPDDLTVTEDEVPAKIERISCGKPDPILLGVLVDVSGNRRFDPHLGSHYEALEASHRGQRTPESPRPSLILCGIGDSKTAVSVSLICRRGAAQPPPKRMVTVEESTCLVSSGLFSASWNNSFECTGRSHSDEGLRCVFCSAAVWKTSTLAFF